jgi:hypothetical protein
MPAIPALAVPDLLQYQGRLTDAGGAPLNGTFSVVFSVYIAAEGGSAIYQETNNVVVNNGLFNILLGSVTPIPSSLFNNDQLFLGITVGSDAEMTPRQQIASVAFAQRAAVAETVIGGGGGGLVAIDHDFAIVTPDLSVTRWIIVNADGTILRQSGGFTVTKGGTGIYRVDHAINESAVGFVASSFNAPGFGTSPCVVTCFANDTNGFNVRVVGPGTDAPEPRPQADPSTLSYDENNLPR